MPILLIAMLFITGCTYYVPKQFSSTSFSSDQVEIVGNAHGYSERYYFLGIPIDGEGTIKDAIWNAIGQEGHTLVNVSVDREISYYPFIIIPIVSKSATHVYGTKVKYKTENSSVKKFYDLKPIESKVYIEGEQSKNLKPIKQEELDKLKEQIRLNEMKNFR